jgi:hypothetical protein
MCLVTRLYWAARPLVATAAVLEKVIKERNQWPPEGAAALEDILVMAVMHLQTPMWVKMVLVVLEQEEKQCKLSEVPMELLAVVLVYMVRVVMVTQILEDQVLAAQAFIQRILITIKPMAEGPLAPLISIAACRGKLPGPALFGSFGEMEDLSHQPM